MLILKLIRFHSNSWERIRIFGYSRKHFSLNSLNRCSSNQLSERANKNNNQWNSDLKTVEARVVPPIKNIKTSYKVEVYLQDLSTKNFLLKKLFGFPISVVQWIQLPKQQKVDSSIRFTAWLGGLIIIMSFWGYFKIHNEEILEKYDEIVLSDIMSKYEGKFVDSKTPSIINLDQILNKLISMNKEFVNDENFNLEWLCVIIDDDQKQELVVDDSMKFVIMTKATLQLCENEHQMAYLLANAMGHYILKHKREPVIVLWLSASGNWFGKDSYLSILGKIDQSSGRFFYNSYQKVAKKLNYSDTLEEEADRVALQLMARACYDIREVDKFAAKCRKLIIDDGKEASEETIDQHRYVYKHSFNDHKMEFISKNLDTFMNFRLKCNCPPLK
ncbi:hypothetical protein RDWZM_007413 [Blomia tropicalis]|uniref:Metalloendopeptidase OMA1, mitochondrial n=1 Tax=Blomia tropicalis TaxID=40697 RepID=A0A9Q0LZS3_BLOTA|nr:hypothetical protein RDWZM_007413 [Blomia tropicalis]